MKINRERKLVPTYQRYFEVDRRLSDLQKEIKELIKEYGPDAFIEGERDNYSDSDRLSYGVYIMAPESDEQYNTRIGHEEKMAHYQEERDALEFERLSKKFAKK